MKNERPGDADRARPLDHDLTECASFWQGENKTLVEGPGNLSSALISWSGEQLAAVWHKPFLGTTGIDILWAGFDKHGTIVNGPKQFDWVGDDRVLALKWAAARYALLYRNSESGVQFRRLSRTGELVGAPRSLPLFVADPSQIAIEWTGTGFGIAWRDHEAVWFLRLDDRGAPIGEPKHISDVQLPLNTPSAAPILAWNGTGFAIVWLDYLPPNHFGLYFESLTVNGADTTTELMSRNLVAAVLAPAATLRPALVWADGGYVLAWNNWATNDRYAPRAYVSWLDNIGQVEQTNLIAHGAVVWHLLARGAVVHALWGFAPSLSTENRNSFLATIAPTDISTVHTVSIRPSQVVAIDNGFAFAWQETSPSDFGTWRSNLYAPIDCVH